MEILETSYLHLNGLKYLINIKKEDNCEPILETDLISLDSGNYFANLKECTASDDKFSSYYNSICCILFTNRKVSDCNLLETAYNDPVTFLNVEGSVYRVSPRNLPLVVDSRRSLYLLANQKIDYINEQIFAELRTILERLELAHQNVESILERFIKYISDWMEDKSNEILTKEDVRCKLAAFILLFYKVNLNEKRFSFHNNEQTNLWSDIVSHMKVTIVNSTELIEEFLFEYIGSQIKKQYKSCAGVWGDYLSIEELFNQENAEFGGKILMDIYDFLWMNGKLPVILEITHAREYKNILRILELSNYHQKTIILNKINEQEYMSTDVSTIKIFNSLLDLEPADQQKILKQSVTLQGRCSVHLESIVDENMFEFITCCDIIKIILNRFDIGYKLQPLPSYFAKRGFSKVFIKVKALDEIKDEIFLIQENSDNRLDMLPIKNINIRRLEQFHHRDYINPRCRIIVTQGDISREQMQAFKLMKKTVHYLKIHNTDYLEWQISFGSIYKIKDLRVELEGTWDTDIDKLFCKPFNIISASTGMGKTVFLDYVAQQVPADKWVLKLNLHDHWEYLQNRVCKTHHTDGLTHLKYFNGYVFELHNCSDRLFEAVFQKFVRTKDLIVLLDGLDSIIVSYKDEVINLIDSLQNVSLVWLTAQPETRCVLDEEFEAFGVTLQPLPVSVQKKLLFRCVSIENVNVEVGFVDKCLEMTQRNFKVKNVEFLKTPLLCKLLAEVFSDETNFKEDFDFIYLIRKSADKIVNRVCTNLAVSKVPAMVQLSFYTLNLLFPEINRKIEDKIHTFSFLHDTVHQTILEYLAAQCFSLKIEKNNELIEIIEKVRLNHGYAIFNALVPLDTSFATHDFNYNTVLHDAVIHRNAEAMINLIGDEQYPYIDQQNVDGNTALHLAIVDSKIKEKVILKLASKITKYNLQNTNGDTFLHLALSKHKPRVTKLLIRKGADVNVENKEGQTALHLAARNGYCDIVTQILTNILDIDKRDYHGRTAIFYAALGNKKDMLKLLVSAGANITVQDATGETVLHRAAFAGHNDIVAELLSNSADVEKLDDIGCTPLFYATYGNQLDTVNLLIAHGADTNAESTFNEIPLHNAAYGGYSDIVTELLANGMEVDKEDIEGAAPLFYAARAGQLNTLKLLIMHGAIVNHQNKDGETALHRAALNGYHDIVIELILNGADINEQTDFGFTPLHLALIENQMDIVKLLICNGASIDVDCKDGQVTKLLQKYVEYSSL